MAECELKSGCLFFNDKMKDTEGLGAIFKKNYCNGDKSQCARYFITQKLGRDKVPTNLYPNMLDKAKEIISRS